MTTTPAGHIAEPSFAEVIQIRRSVRQVCNSADIDQARIERIVTLALNAPSAFNMQSGRLVVLMGDHHHKLWDIVRDTLRPIVPPADFPNTEKRLENFRNGAGTILFFEDQTTIKKMQEQAPLYKDQFPRWSEQGSAMLQYAVWLALTADGLSASLQHYNPLIDEQVKQEWSLPKQWQLIAQMPFGKAAEQPLPPPKLPMDVLVKWHV